MGLSQVTAGRKFPEETNVIIEIPPHSDPVKHETHKARGAMFVDRFMTTAMHYPCNYGSVAAIQALHDAATRYANLLGKHGF